jgi:hypothetical protein
MWTGAQLVVVGLCICVVCVLQHGGREGHAYGSICCCFNDVDQPWLDDLDIAAGQVCTNAELHVSAIHACTSTDCWIPGRINGECLHAMVDRCRIFD